MRIDILALFPEMLDGFFAHSIIKRAKEKNLIEIFNHNIRDYSQNKHKKVDDYPYGGESGMVMMIEPIDLCIEKLKNERKYDEIIYLTPDGELLNQKVANKLSLYNNLLFICGHYKGIDQRVRDYLITKEISIGNYVLSGGELGAAVVIDSIVRLIPGVLNDETSALNDSFQNDLLSYPVYTRPSIYKNMEVPKILLSGNFKEIDKWKFEKSFEKTQKQRPDLIFE